MRLNNKFEAVIKFDNQARRELRRLTRAVEALVAAVQRLDAGSNSAEGPDLTVGGFTCEGDGDETPSRESGKTTLRPQMW